MFKLELDLENKYNIFIDDNINVGEYISDIFENKNIYVITDDVVAKLHLNDLLKKLTNYNVNVVTIKSGEKYKNLSTYETISSKLIDMKISRDSLIIGFGGGVVGDISAFVASTILRGVKYVSIPTTLLSQVDSSIGGKTALNLNSKKNIIGTFYHPSLVLIDTMYLNTLPKDEYNNGLGEVIKCGMIKNKGILSLLQDNFDLKEIIYKCLLVKKHFVELDPFDRNERMILNFGHTFGHVIELERKVKHGLAVIDGMILAIKYSIDLKLCDDSCLNILLNVLDKLNISYNNFNYKDYINKLDNDKKNTENEYTFIFLNDIALPIIKKVKRK